MSILGYMIVRNEADIIGEVISYYRHHQIPLCVVDNGSTDGTWEILLEKRDLLASLLRHETEDYDLSEMLQLAVQRCQSLGPTWMLHVDADHFYDYHAEFDSFQSMVEAAEDASANCIQFSEYTFFVTSLDEVFVPSAQERMRYYAYHDGLPQPRLFKNLPGVDTHTGGGHRVVYDNAPVRVFPFSGALRHYPFRTIEQAARKLRERRARYSTKGLEKGWHIQYSGTDVKDWFFDDPSVLKRWDVGRPLVNEITTRDILKR